MIGIEQLRQIDGLIRNFITVREVGQSEVMDGGSLILKVWELSGEIYERICISQL